MIEIILAMAVLFLAYLFIPANWFSKAVSDVKKETIGGAGDALLVIPEDSVLRRHFITQLRSEIEMEFFPRPTDFTLQRHYDAMVEAELVSRLTVLAA